MSLIEFESLLIIHKVLPNSDQDIDIKDIEDGLNKLLGILSEVEDREDCERMLIMYGFLPNNDDEINEDEYLKALNNFSNFIVEVEQFLEELDM